MWPKTISFFWSDDSEYLNHTVVCFKIDFMGGSHYIGNHTLRLVGVEMLMSTNSVRSVLSTT